MLFKKALSKTNDVNSPPWSEQEILRYVDEFWSSHILKHQTKKS